MQLDRSTTTDSTRDLFFSDALRVLLDLQGLHEARCLRVIQRGPLDCIKKVMGLRVSWVVDTEGLVCSGEHYLDRLVRLHGGVAESEKGTLQGISNNVSHGNHKP